MAIRLSTGLRNGMLGTQTFKELTTNGWLEIYTGSQPTSADFTETAGATKLAVISTTSGKLAADGLDWGTAASGVLPKSADTWNGVVLATGVAGWFRWYGSDGTTGCHGTSGTAIRFDGNVGVSGADLNLSHTNLTINSTLTVTDFNVTQPAED